MDKHNKDTKTVTSQVKLKGTQNILITPHSNKQLNRLRNQLLHQQTQLTPSLITIELNLPPIKNRQNCAVRPISHHINTKEQPMIKHQTTTITKQLK